MTEKYEGEPTSAGLDLSHEDGRSVRAAWRGTELFRYVYGPWDPQVESPRPYFHPVRTLGGRLVSLYRPHDHVWHKGIAWSLSNVGDQNFWGGPTYLRAEGGYAQLANDGTMAHTGFDRLALVDGGVRLDERLTWVTQAGVTLIEERRQIAVTVLPDMDAWHLAFRTTMHNVSGQRIPFGSPTTEGRDNAGYSGLFWRGPRSFSDGRVVTADAVGGDEMMGYRGPWLGYVGRHDGDGGSSTLVFTDHEDNPMYPNEWFVRTGMYACVSSAPFFSKVYDLVAGGSLTLRNDILVADGARDRSACGELAARAATVSLDDPA